MKPSITKTDLVRAIALAHGQTQDSIRPTFDAIFDMIAAEAKAGKIVKIAGFGSFEIKTSPARTARNPATGGTVEVPEKSKLVFKATKPRTA